MTDSSFIWSREAILMAQYSYTFADWYGGMSDNPYVTANAQFVDAAQLDIRTYAPSVWPQIWFTEAFTTSSTTQMLCAADWFAFGEWGKIYYLPSGTNVKTMTDTKSIKTAVRRKWYYVWFYANASNAVTVWKIAVSDANTSSWTGWSYNETRNPSWRATYDILDSTCHVPVCEFEWQLIVGNKNQVLVISGDDWSEVTTQWLVSLSGDVIWLANEGSRVAVYLKNGRKLFRDWVSDSFTEAKKFDIEIRHVYDAGGYQYVVWWYDLNYSELFVSAWYEMKKLKDQATNSFITCANGARNWMAMFNGITYMSGVCATLDTTDYCVYSYGSYHNNLPTAWNAERWKTNNWNTIREISMIHIYRWVLYVWYYDATAAEYGVDKADMKITYNFYWIGMLGSGSWLTSSYLTTKVFDWWPKQRHLKKRIKSIRVTGDFQNAASALTIKYQDVINYGMASRKWLLEYWYDNSAFTTLASIVNTDSNYGQRIYTTDVDIEFFALQLRILFDDKDAKLTQITIEYDLLPQP